MIIAFNTQRSDAEKTIRNTATIRELKADSG
jgi:hypothetical protein